MAELPRLSSGATFETELAFELSLQGLPRVSIRTVSPRALLVVYREGNVVGLAIGELQRGSDGFDVVDATTAVLDAGGLAVLKRALAETGL